MRKVIVLGATGSIGMNALHVAEHLGAERMTVVGLSAHRRGDELRELAAAWRPAVVAVTDSATHDRLAADWDAAHGRLVRGQDGVLAMIRDTAPDVVLQAMVGADGLEATVETVDRGIDLALANKESIVIAGPLVMARAKASGSRILPVDSEHAAIFQALGDAPPASVKRILLTGSGGPFRTRPIDELATVTKAEALDHPVWSMGPKITIDSATMMNKALEIIEARWLFDVPADRIEVVIHPQGVVHSMVEFVDGNVLAQLGPPDMKIPIQHALTYPERLAGPVEGFSFERYASLTMERPSFERFPALRLGFEAARIGGTAGAVLNAANEVAVDAFLHERIGYVDIVDVVERVFRAHVADGDDVGRFVESPTLDDVRAADRAAREAAARWVDAGVR